MAQAPVRGIKLEKMESPSTYGVGMKCQHVPFSMSLTPLKKMGSTYQVGEKILEITEREYEAVRRNPNLYYFSTACKLHYRIGLENKGTRLTGRRQTDEREK